MARGMTEAGFGPHKRWLRQAMIWLLAAVLGAGAWTGGAAAAGEAAPAEAGAAAGPTRAQIDEAIAALQTAVNRIVPLSDWAAIGLARSGKSAAARYLPLAEAEADGGSLRLVTDYARTAIAVGASGGNVRALGKSKLNLLSAIANYEKMTAQGPNAPAYALLALDAGGYTPGLNDKWSRDALVKWLVDHRNADGGWSLASAKSDIDVTGIVLTALAPYRDRETVRAAVDGALAWLSGKQLANGGFGGQLLESSESAVQVLLALTSLGIDPARDERFVKDGHTILERLMAFRQPDGRFAHLPGGAADDLASLYALLGLTAAQRFQDGLPPLFAEYPAGETAEVAVYGTSGTLAAGKAAGKTVLESLLGVLRSDGVSYRIEKHPSLGPMLVEVAGVGGDAAGGYWLFAVERDGAWLPITEGMGTMAPKAGDRIAVYYAGSNTALIHGVTFQPAAPREGQSVTVTVEKETYDWESGKTIVTPAAGADVRAAGQSLVTDQEGKATFTAPKPGTYKVDVSGYRGSGTPDYVAVQRQLQVSSYKKNVGIRIEGDAGTLAVGQSQGGTALEALESFLKARNVPYEVKELSIGKYVASIGGIEAGKYGGYDGWLFAAKGEAGWIVPGEGIGTFLLEDGQELVVYYGGDTKLPEPVAVSPAVPEPGKPVTVTVTYREMDWEKGAPGAPQPLAGVKVAAAGVSAVTDAAGKAVLAALPEGVHELTVTGYAAGQAPAAVPVSTRLIVAAPYGDQSQVAGWASDWVRTARAAGILHGPEDRVDAFKPKQAVTRAEFVAALARAMGLTPKTGTSFKDVNADAWYAGELQAAYAAGLVAGTAPGMFAPNASLTREQAAQLLTRALKLQANGTQTYADEASVSAGAKAAVQAVLADGWMTLDGKERFLPKMTMPREQAAVIAVRVLQRPGIGRLGDA